MSSNFPANTSPILVTGAHRTGTTWVGKMLAASGEAGYISEPLNKLHRLGVMRAPIQFWYTYINAQNEDRYLPALAEMLHFRYHLLSEMPTLRSFKDLLRMGRDWSGFLASKMHRKRPLIKDPFAFFSIPWFIERLGCQVVLTVRHPAGFASSLKRLGWTFDFNDLLQQPLLMHDWLEPFREDMESMLKTPGDIIGQASLLWRMIYHVAEISCRRFPQIQLVRHEDLSLQTVDGFSRLYAALGLRFDSKVKGTILKASSAENPAEASRKAVYTVRLDSAANLDNWKRRLSSAEICRIRSLTGETAERYYPEHSWEVQP